MRRSQEQGPLPDRKFRDGADADQVRFVLAKTIAMTAAQLFQRRPFLAELRDELVSLLRGDFRDASVTLLVDGHGSLSYGCTSDTCGTSARGVPAPLGDRPGAAEAERIGVITLPPLSQSP